MSTSTLNVFHDESESSTATLCSTKALSEHSAEATLAFVEVLKHNVVMLHSDQEPVLVQLLKNEQNKRPIETSVRQGPRISHQSQGKIGDVNQVSATLENLLRQKLSNCSTLFAWPIRHAAQFPVTNDGRTALLRVSGEPYTSRLPFEERVMYEHTAVPTGNLNQRWGHGIWIGEAPMTDECIIPTENGFSETEIVAPRDTQGEVLDQ